MLQRLEGEGYSETEEASWMGNFGTWDAADKSIHLCLCSTFIKFFFLIFFNVRAHTLGSKDTEK